MVAVEVKKSQHKYIIGTKGQNLQEILAETGVSVEVPPLDTPSDTITLRGDADKLGMALTAVYTKVSICFCYYILQVNGVNTGRYNVSTSLCICVQMADPWRRSIHSKTQSYRLQILRACSQGQLEDDPLQNFWNRVVARVTWPPTLLGIKCYLLQIRCISFIFFCKFS